MTVVHTIHIDAPSEIVWAVTADVERWPEWTPTVTSASLLDDRPLGLGSVACLKQPGWAASEWRVTDLKPGESLLVLRHGLKKENNGLKARCEALATAR